MHTTRSTEQKAFTPPREIPMETNIAALRTAIDQRHSVRSFTDEPLSVEDQAALRSEIQRCNGESGLSIKLVCNEPKAFDSLLAHYGKFTNVRNYLVLAGPDAPDLDERCGYYGERLVLLAQTLGLNSCWVALTFKKRLVKKAMDRGDKLNLVVALGHGTTQGMSRKSKGADEVSSVAAGIQRPAWFDAGVAAALLAPTAMNQQNFKIELIKGAEAGEKARVSLRSTGGPYSAVDLGIVKLHFELGAGVENFAWM